MITETPRSFVVRAPGSEEIHYSDSETDQSIHSLEQQFTEDTLRELEGIHTILEDTAVITADTLSEPTDPEQRVDSQSQLRLLDTAQESLANIQEITSDHSIFTIDAAKELTTAIAAIHYTPLGAEGEQALLDKLHPILEGVIAENSFNSTSRLSRSDDEKRKILSEAAELQKLITAYEGSRNTSQGSSLETLAKLTYVDRKIFEKIETPVEQTPEQTPENEKPSPRKGALGTFVTRLLNRR